MGLLRGLLAGLRTGLPPGLWTGLPLGLRTGLPPGLRTGLPAGRVRAVTRLLMHYLQNHVIWLLLWHRSSINEPLRHRF